LEEVAEAQKENQPESHEGWPAAAPDIIPEKNGSQN
jgi:hypothetical protein